MTQIRLKIFFTLSFFTAVLTAVELHFVEPLFNSRWLKPAVFDSLFDKFLFVTMILALSFAAVGIWLTVWFKLFDRVTRKSKKIDFIAPLMWNIFLWFDFYIRYKIFLVWGGNFRLDTTKASTEETGQIITNLWRWYSTDIILIFSGIPIAVLFTYLMIKVLASDIFTFKVPGQAVKRLFRYIVLSSIVIVILFLTAFVSIWPEGRSAIAVQSSIGYPFAQSISIASDFDNDGWGYFDVPSDLKPFDPRCRPYAIDIPNDGFDQDLMAGDLKSKELTRWQKRYGESITSPMIAHDNNSQNIMVVFVESLRFDALKKMIGNRKVMPNMQKMIKNGALSPNYAY
ncbi:MAG: hypothetical protein JXR91_06580, partial [Deltaproteobacteria bacterium]|nr:hypothetical protein [Deltaproteobacteria bacterium]